MHRPNLAIVTQLMRGAVDRMQKAGKVHFREDRIVKLNEVFSFRPEDVKGVTYTGDGVDSVHFHLQNGRVFDGYGKASDSVPSPA